ncbi:MAG: dehydrogenase [Paludibacteraceae bacterium]|nr:dehydrogenase [Paludibacteraceae bacterium]
MADNWLEKHYADYEQRRQAWLRKQGKSAAASRERQNPWSD